jgi:hypothetical protein
VSKNLDDLKELIAAQLMAGSGQLAGTLQVTSELLVRAVTTRVVAFVKSLTDDELYEMLKQEEIPAFKSVRLSGDRT